jgi:hypothetical protein
MADKPNDGYPKWAYDLENATTTGVPNKNKPSTQFQQTGLLPGQPPYRGHLNYQLDLIDKWIEYLDTATYDLLIRVDALDGLGTTPVNIPPE